MKFIQFLNKRTKKITLCLCSLIVFELLYPVAALALTAGPTAPEATSFEPVDTTDMVNPLTGSLTYNLPLLEVPGPDGGYPLSLSYHAGIQPDLEASWVGLGWTLNPGAINRNVSGLPDDFNEVKMKRRDFWTGGKRKDYGLEVGFASMVNVGLVFASDTYKGFGVGGSVGFGVKISGSPYGASVDVGLGPFGGGYVGLSASVGMEVSKGVSATTGIGLSTNFSSVNAGGGVSLSQDNGKGKVATSLLSASMSTSSNKPSLSVMGSSASVANQNAGKISTSSSGFGLGIPLIVVNIGVSFRSQRYWIDETAEVASSGTLYSPIFPSSAPLTELNGKAFDNYRLLPDNLNIADNPEDYEFLGGTYPEYDNYSISGQGIGGQIRPFLYQRTLHLQDNDPQKSISKPGATNTLFKQGVGFRFINDFSNSFDQGLGNVENQYGTASDINTLPFSMGGQAEIRINNEVAGSKFIKFFTNDEIRTKTAKAKGFIDVGSTAKGFSRLANNSLIGTVSATKGGSQIGGFMVTNESGVTYHYALPVYSYKEYSYNYTSKQNGRYTETERNEPYAYTWLLTAVTGPDYVDRNDNGLVDDADWGYWVALDYGKWTDGYVWRTPAQDMDIDLDQSYSMYTSGQKQLFYLNRIRTRTHTAIFEKEVRLDGKGSSTSSLEKKAITGAFNTTSSQSLRLNRIYLVNNANTNIVTESSSSVATGRNEDLYKNVIDNHDVQHISRSVIDTKSIRIIDFGSSYNLSGKTPNSFNIQQPDVKFGKLTLDRIKFLGKGGADLLPATIFSYDIPGATFKGNITAKNQITSTNETLQVGMMVEKAGDDPVYYGMITKIDLGPDHLIYTLANGDSNIAIEKDVSLKVTKNPSYCKNCHDIWGFYKGDIEQSVLDINEDLARRVTKTSSFGTDAWNLRKISSPTGNSIAFEFESNDYGRTVFERNLSFPIGAYTHLNEFEMAVSVPISKEEFNKYYDTGEVINGVFAVSFSITESNPMVNQFCKYNGWTSDGRLKLKFQNSAIYFQGGNIRLRQDAPITYGGGPRIKNISNKQLNGTSFVTSYYYNDNSGGMGTDFSMGVTSYVPYNIEIANLNQNAQDSETIRSFKLKLNQNLDNVLKYAREIPGPGVMYERVLIRNKVIQPNGDHQSEGHTVNIYRVLDKNMINRLILQQDNWGKARVNAVNLTISDFTTNVGDLKGILYYNANGTLIKEINNHYLIDDVASAPNFRNAYRTKLKDFNSQGLITERFAEARYHYGKTYDNRTNIVMSAREQYPSILLSSTTTDHVNKFSEKTTNLGFDFMNGKPNKVLTKDSYGNYFLAKTGFAYLQYPEMGSKLKNKDYKNMLSQVFSQVNYKVDGKYDTIAVLSATKTIWSKVANVLTPEGDVVKQNTITNGIVWRKLREEILEIPDKDGGSGMLPIGEFKLDNEYWKIVNTMSLYNVFSKGLEDYDRNNSYSANRYGYKNSKLIAGANFSKYSELAFSGAEDEVISSTIPGEVLKGKATVSSASFHTGSKSLSVPAGENGFEYTVPIAKLTANRTYTVSVWVKNSTNGNVKLYYDIDGVVVASPINSAQSSKKSGEWSLVHLEIPITKGTNLKIYVKNDGAAASFVDDFRFHPKNVVATAYVYDSFSGELTYILDHLNLFTRFEYDASGRLVRTYKEQFGKAPYKTNEYQINYGNAKSLGY